MDYQQEATVECDACGKTVPKSEIRYLRLKTCCSYRSRKCWEETHKKA